jgi:hypothetical protein
MNDPHVATQRRIGPPPEHVSRLIADVRAHHPRFLPPAFSDFEVEQGGIEAGTVHSFKLTAGAGPVAIACGLRGRVAGADREPLQGAAGVGSFFERLLRRGCCAGSTPTNSSGWIATPAAAPD